MTRLILVRHGQSVANIGNFYSGQLDVRLSEFGSLQAAATAKYIAENYSVDQIYSSDLIRALETAQPLAGILGKEIISSENLREVHAGLWEGLPFDEIHLKFPEEFLALRNDIENASYPRGESIKELGARMCRKLDAITKRHEGQTIAVFSHAAALRAVLSFLAIGNFGGSFDQFRIPNASISMVTKEKEIYQVEAVGMDAHLADLNQQMPISP